MTPSLYLLIGSFFAALVLHNNDTRGYTIHDWIVDLFIALIVVFLWAPLFILCVIEYIIGK